MERRRKILFEVAMAAGTAVRDAIPSKGVVTKDGRANIVTAADLTSEKEITRRIKAHFPGDLILSEETDSDLGDLLRIDHLWVIDPIDGTNNFRFQRNYSAVSIGYVEKGKIVLAAAYDPFRDELFYAQKGKGAYVNRKRISVNPQKDLHRASVAMDNSYDPKGTEHNLRLFLRINPSPWILVKGSAVLTMCEVAAGRIDLYFHTALKPWDNAAAFLIAREAGGVVKDFEGKNATFLTPEVVVGNSMVVNQCLRAFKGEGR